jgi:hypothetical protein
MGRTIVTFVVVIFILPTAYAQTSGDTLFTILYQPSFHNPSQLTVYKDKEGSKGSFETISVIDGKVKIDTTIAALSNETYTAYSNFFSTYRFPGYVDNKLPDTTKNYVQGMDGITIVGAYYGDTKKLFRFWSPYHDKESMALFKMTLSDLDKYFKTGSNKKYLKWLKMYAK